MAQCGICEEKEGVREAGVYMDGEKKAVPVCAGCVYEAMRRNFYGIGFGAGLQLCWFVVASKGLFSVPGIFAAAIALYGLVRLALLLAARQGERGPCAGLGVEACHGPGCDGGCPARRLCGTVLQCKGADAA